MFATQTPEQKAAAAEDRAASRDAISVAKQDIQKWLGDLKKFAAKEDYEPAKKIYKDGLDWLKAHPTSPYDDIKDYMSNLIAAPLIQSISIRNVYYQYLHLFEDASTKRMKYLQDKKPEQVASATELLTPMQAYRDKIQAWLESSRMTLLPADYDDKTAEIKEEVTGPDGKEDLFKIGVFLNDVDLQKFVVSKQSEDASFDFQRFIKKLMGICTSIIGIIVIGWCSFLGASYAMNRNIYRSFWFRVFYMIYGALNWLWIIPYELIYNRWWLGAAFLLQGDLPLFEGPLDSWSWIGKTFFFMFEKRSYLSFPVYGEKVGPSVRIEIKLPEEMTTS